MPEALAYNRVGGVGCGVYGGIPLLAQLGRALGFPHSSKIKGSRHKAMRELRTAVLLIGADKTGDDRWYESFVPLADRLWEEHLDELREEGKL